VLADGTISTAGIADAFGANYLISSAGVATCLAALPAGPCPKPNTFLAPAGASALGAVDALSGDVVDFQQVNGNLKRNAGRTNPYYRTDLSVTRSFHIPWRETTVLELRADLFNVFNHTNFNLYNAAPNTSQMVLPSIAPGWQNCTGCLNPLTGQYIGTNGQALTLAALQHGRISPNLLNPIFNGLGDPGSTDLAREIQLSLRVRF
jgi:hypothetical protein